MLDFGNVKAVTIPEGNVFVIACDGNTLWKRIKYKRELLYLESTGTQYIDTGYKPSSETRVTGEFYINDYVGTAANYVFGVYYGTTSGAKNYGLNVGSASLYFNVPWKANSGVRSDSVPAIGTVYAFDVSKAGGYVNDVLDVVIPNDQDFTAGSKSMYLFWANGTSGSGLNGRIYHLQIYESDTLVRDFVPVLDTNDVPCMYDKVSGEFFYNQGDDEFSYAELPRLPLEYQEVEYLQSTGTQYIDTGVYSTGSHTVEATALATQQSYSYFVFGARSVARGDIYACLVHSSERIGYRVGTGGFLYSSGYDATDEKHTYKIENGVLYRDDVVVDDTCENASTSPNCTLALLTIKTNGTLDNTQTFRGYLYSCRISDNGVLVRDFVPCYRKSDSKPGLYDLVNGEFYVNAASSDDDFTGGEEVTTEVTTYSLRTMSLVEDDSSSDSLLADEEIEDFLVGADK